MPIHRTFLNWDRPALHGLVAFTLQRYREGEELAMRDVLVVLPGLRAMQRLEELLLEAAEAEGLRLVPPRMITAGSLLEMLCPQPEEPIADAAARRFAWMRAIADASHTELQALIPHPPAANRWAELDALAGTVDRLYIELAGAGIGFVEAADAALQQGGPGEAERWNVCETLLGRFHGHLQGAGLCDEHSHRLRCVNTEEVSWDGEIIMIASDLSLMQKRALGQVAGDVHSLVFAPQSLEDRFDELGTIRSDAWAAATIAIQPQQVRIVDNPARQADAAIAAIAERGETLTADQIALCLPDANVRPHLQLRAMQHDLPIHFHDGLPIESTGPYRLLAAVADYLQSRSFRDFASLVRHAELETMLAGGATESATDPDRAAEDWCTLLDEYYADHLQGELFGEWLGEKNRAMRLKDLHDSVLQWLGELTGPARPCGQWASPVLHVLLRVYDADQPADERWIEQQYKACEVLHRQAESLLRLPESLHVEMDAAEFLRMLLRGAAGGRLTEDPQFASIDAMGWLDLSLDDRPIAMVTGMNEGVVPESVVADAFLPDGVRRQLGLRDNAQRYARDAYLLSAVLASRSVCLIAGRADDQGDPLLPSRLLLACEDAELADRVHHLATVRPIVLRPATMWTPAKTSRMVVPKASAPESPVRRISVTAFKDYLACPYRFYLGHVLKLGHVEDAAEELDGGVFGGLAHQVLRRLHGSPVALETDSAKVADQLSRWLDDVVLRQFGSRPQAAVRVQAEQLRYRLELFAHHQAQRAAEGWRIARAECPLADGPIWMEAAGERFELVGRIDRVDECDGHWAILDYKTGNTVPTPEKAHRKGGDWIDLQLPLYAYALRQAGFSGKLSLGYIAISQSEKEIGFQFAEWEEDELNDAAEVARGVLEGIARNEFERATLPPQFDAFADICGVTHMESIMVTEEDESEEEE